MPAMQQQHRDRAADRPAEAEPLGMAAQRLMRRRQPLPGGGQQLGRAGGGGHLVQMVDGKAAGDIAAAMPAHAVGDRPQAEVRPAKREILVQRAHGSGIGGGGPAHGG